MAELVGKRYAEALFEVALEMEKLEDVEEEITFVSNVFEKEDRLKTVFEHPKLSKTEKKDIVNSLFKEKLSKEVMNLLYITIDKGRERFIKDIKNSYISLSNEERGIVEASAVTAVPMSDKEISKLQDNLSKKLNKNVKLKNITDESIIGGVLIRIEDRVMDSSIKGKLEDIQKSLKNIKVTKIGVKN